MSIGLSDFLSEGFLNVKICPIFSKKRKIGRPIPLGRKIGQAYCTLLISESLKILEYKIFSKNNAQRE